MARDKSSNKSRKDKDKRNSDSPKPGQGGGRGYTPPRSSNPQDWKNEPGNQS